MPCLARKPDFQSFYIGLFSVEELSNYHDLLTNHTKQSQYQVDKQFYVVTNDNTHTKHTNKILLRWQSGMPNWVQFRQVGLGYISLTFWKKLVRVRVESGRINLYVDFFSS
jgi:uncharacterized protein YecA (UPF0149 family)